MPDGPATLNKLLSGGGLQFVGRQLSAHRPAASQIHEHGEEIRQNEAVILAVPVLSMTFSELSSKLNRLGLIVYLLTDFY